jgi:hypothetical protein
MIQFNKIFRAHIGCWDYGSTDEPKYSKNPIFKHTFFSCQIEQKTIFDESMVSNMTHSRTYGRKIIQLVQLVRISYQKLDFHGISRFSAVFIITNLNAWK